MRVPLEIENTKTNDEILRSELSLWSGIFGVTSLKMTSLSVTILLYTIVNLSFSNPSYQKYRTTVPHACISTALFDDARLIF